jgi:hypothetical protein
LAKPALGIALTLGALSAGQAQAFVVNVGGQNYDVTTFDGSYNANTSKFATAANGGVMPWWGSSTLATDIATAVGSSLGTPNSGSGPVFSYTLNGSNLSSFYFNGTIVVSDDIPLNITPTYAQATLLASAPAAPGPLPALGAAAAFRLSRKLRKRVKGSTNAVSSTSSL